VGQVIRWGIWGTGAIAHALAGDMKLAGNAKLQAVASRTEERARRFGDRYGAVKCYGGIDPLLNDPAVDVVYIATPNHRHLDDSLACLQAGKAVLCEKPFALNLAQVERIAATARQRKVFCMEAMWTRFIPAVIEAKRAIDAGAIGPIRLMQGNFAYPSAPSPKANILNRELGGGALLDRGVYLVSLAQHLLGASVSVRASACFGPTGVDEQSAYQLVYESGALADFAASLRTRGTNEAVISGDHGVMRLCEPFYRSHRLVTKAFSQPASDSGGDAAPSAGFLRGVIQSSAATSLRRRWSPVLDILQRGRVQSFPFPGNGYQFQIQHVSDCLRQQRTESPIMPLNDSLEVMRVMDLLSEQMRTAR
jgi:predicted dehydrogenase